MHNIVGWLQGLEAQVSHLYREAALLFQDDPEFADFLMQLSADETVHARLIGEVADYLRENRLDIQAAFDLTPVTIDLVESPLRRAQNLIAEQGVSKKQMLELIVNIEYHEWNNILLRYVIVLMKPYNKKFQHSLAIIEDHEERIQRFMDALPDDFQVAGAAVGLPQVWRRRFLVVDDEEAMRVLLSRILARRGIVETAVNGQEALDKVKANFFDAVIADIDMPVMNGLKFFEEAVRDDPSAAKRFVFCTSQPPDEPALALGALWVVKPFSLPDIDRAVDEVLANSSSR